MTERFVEAGAGRLAMIIHTGAQTTADTVALSAHAAETGADGVGVIGAAVLRLRRRLALRAFRSGREGLRAAAVLRLRVRRPRAAIRCRSPVLARLRDAAENFVGLKVSDSPYEAFAPYLVDGLDVFVGPETLIAEGMRAGAVGAVSGLAAGFPELVAAVVRNPTEEGAEHLGGRPRRGAAVSAPVGAQADPRPPRRAARGARTRPIRSLTEAERAELERELDDPGTTLGAASRINRFRSW